MAQTISVKKTSPGNWPFFCLCLSCCLLTDGWKWSEVPPALPHALELWVTKSLTPIDSWTSRCVDCPAAADFLEDIWNSLSPSKFRKTYTLVKEENKYGFAKTFTIPQQNCLSSPYIQTSLPSSQWLRFISCLVFCHSVLFLACASIKILSLLECQMPKDILLPQRLHLKNSQMTEIWKLFPEANTIFFSIHKNILFFFYHVNL